MAPDIIKGAVFSVFASGILYFLYKKRNSPILFLILIAFLLRLSLAVLTEYVHLPEYYLSDSQRYHQKAWEVAYAWRRFGSTTFVESFGHLNYERVIAAVYFLTGPSLFLAKSFNCLLGALTVGLVFKVSTRLVGQTAAGIAAVLFAIWPSIVFTSSQNYRDSLIIFLLLSSVYFMLKFAWDFRLRDLSFSTILAFASGLLRPEVMALMGLPLLLWCVAFALKKRNLRLLLPLVPALVMVWAGWYLSPTIPMGKELAKQGGAYTHQGARMREGAHAWDFSPIPQVISSVRDSIMRGGRAVFYLPQRPQVISSVRDSIMRGIDPKPESAIFEGMEFKTWLDVLVFLPKGIFYILFMPLPGLFPLTNVWRKLSSAENLVLLFLTTLAVKSFISTKTELAHSYVLLLMIVIVSIHALITPDLGTATRHKIYYLPFIFAFAAHTIARWRNRFDSARKG